MRYSVEDKRFLLFKHVLNVRLRGMSSKLDAVTLFFARLLRGSQYHQRGSVHVLPKGGHVQRFIPIQRQHRDVLDAWLEQRGDVPGPLYPTRSGKRLDRTQAFLILKRIARPINISSSRRTSCAICCCAKWPMRRGCTTPWSSRGIGAIGISGAMCGPMPRASPRRSMTSSSRRGSPLDGQAGETR
jgi:hypothetical protein